MALVSFGEAAQLCGHKSRSTLYNLKQRGLLEGYLGMGPKGHPWLETHPPGREPLVSYVLAVVRLQWNSPGMALAQKQLERTEPPAPLAWDGYVRLAGPADPPLSYEEKWQHIASLFDASFNDTFPAEMSWQKCHSMWLLLNDAIESIEGGGRWDPLVWLRASLSDAREYHEREWVESLLDSGNLPPDLEAEARAFLASAPPPPPEDGNQNPGEDQPEAMGETGPSIAGTGGGSSG